MKHSTQRILTTHVGSLARTDGLLPLLRLKEQGQPYNREELARQVREAVAYVVQKQVEAGVDIVTDGDAHFDSDVGGQICTNYPPRHMGGFDKDPKPTPAGVVARLVEPLFHLLATASAASSSFMASIGIV